MRLRETSRSTGRTQVDVILDAIRDNLKQLDKLTAPWRTTEDPGPFKTRSRNIVQVGETTTVSLRIEQENLDVIDDLAAKHGVKRSHLIVAALNA